MTNRHAEPRPGEKIKALLREKHINSAYFVRYLGPQEHEVLALLDDREYGYTMYALRRAAEYLDVPIKELLS